MLTKSDHDGDDHLKDVRAALEQWRFNKHKDCYTPSSYTSTVLLPDPIIKKMHGLRQSMTWKLSSHRWSSLNGMVKRFLIYSRGTINATASRKRRRHWKNAKQKRRIQLHVRKQLHVRNRSMQLLRRGWPYPSSSSCPLSLIAQHCKHWLWLLSTRPMWVIVV